MKKTFEVEISFIEPTMHYATLDVEAESQEEAEKIVKARIANNENEKIIDETEMEEWLSVDRGVDFSSLRVSGG